MKNSIYLLLLSMALSSCARQGSLTGGVKDTIPPALDTLHSSPNYVTRFDQQKIELVFREWVVLKDVTKEVLISPPLEKNPTITIKKKTVVVDFGDKIKLRPNTTYTINFGEAIRDLTEGNAAKDLRYVFSTGEAIDSLKVEGVVVDALTGAPVENIAVMLYDQLDDSIIIKEKPYYFSRTDKGGIYSIKNVKPGAFKMVAIDEGQAPNLKWNVGIERIGFPDSLIVLSDSMPRFSAVIPVFKNEGLPRTTEKNANNYGVVRVGWTDKAPKGVSIRAAEGAPVDLRILIEPSKDTSLVWYDYTSAAAPWILLVGNDSIRVKALDRSSFSERHRLRPFEVGAAGTTGRGRGAGGKVLPPPLPTKLPEKSLSQIPGRDIATTFNYPMAGADTTKWLVTQDSAIFRNFTVRLDSLIPRNLRLSGDWKAGKTLRITLFPGAITDYYGLTNVDTIAYQLKVLTDKQLGGLNLTVEQTKPGMAYIVEILNGTTKEADRKFVAKGTTEKLQFRDLQAATYTATLVEDRNANGQWDTGSYFDHRQPELILTKKLEPIRANWEVEATISAQKDTGKRN